MFVFWAFRDKYDIDNQQRAIFLSHPPRQKAIDNQQRAVFLSHSPRQKAMSPLRGLAFRAVFRLNRPPLKEERLNIKITKFKR